jgi:hypothetical protein
VLLPEEHVDAFAVRQRAREAFEEAESIVAEFRTLGTRVASDVSGIEPSAPDARTAPLDGLASVRSALSDELSTEQGLHVQVHTKRAQIEANNKRRTQVIIGLIGVPILLIAILLVAIL